MKKVVTYKGAVMTWETDSNRHMNVMYYVNKFEHAGRYFNLTLNWFKKGQDDKVGIVVLEQKINYFKEVFEDDLLHVESSLLGISSKTYTVLHEMYNSQTEELVSTMQIVLVLFDKIERKALPLPKIQKEKLMKALKAG